MNNHIIFLHWVRYYSPLGATLRPFGCYTATIWVHNHGRLRIIVSTAVASRRSTKLRDDALDEPPRVVRKVFSPKRFKGESRALVPRRK